MERLDDWKKVLKILGISVVVHSCQALCLSSSMSHVCLFTVKTLAELNLVEGV